MNYKYKVTKESIPENLNDCLYLECKDCIYDEELDCPNFDDEDDTNEL